MPKKADKKKESKAKTYTSSEVRQCLGTLAQYVCRRLDELNILLKQKVDRGEFTVLERRVSAVEVTITT